MGMPKGRTGNPNGRTVGTKNRKTIEWEIIKDSFMTTHTARFNRIMASADDDKFAEYYLKLLEYFKPKLARSEVTTGESTQVQINVIWDDDTKFVHQATKASLQSGQGTEGSQEV